jgi:CubicO group peptidase (beta-lactamase class C family)
MEDGGWDRKLLATNNDVLATLMNWQPPRAYRPNSNFNYCNTNYVLLALIVEKQSGLPFPEYMKRTFFDPLGMMNTYVHTIEDSARTTPSYDGYGSEWQLDFSDGPYGDKNVYSTPRDLLKWDQAWYNGSVLNQPLVDSAFLPYSNERPSTYNYGLGWRLLMQPNDKKVIYHNGRWHGFNSAFARLPDEKVTIIILTNKFNRNVYSVSRKMYNLFGKYGGKDEVQE